MSDHPQIKIGDKLACRDHYSSQWLIKTVDKITPSGRVKCGTLELNPDLSVRGRGDGWTSPHRLQIATPDILEDAHRQQMAYRIQGFKHWMLLSTDQLENVISMMKGASNE